MVDLSIVRHIVFAWIFFTVVSGLQFVDYPANGVVAGRTYVISYSPADNTPTTFVLRQGPNSDLGTVATIGTATGGQFTWTVPEDLPSGADYVLQILQGSDYNYSGQFAVAGGSSDSTPSTPTAATSQGPAAPTVVTTSADQPTATTPTSSPRPDPAQSSQAQTSTTARSEIQSTSVPIPASNQSASTPSTTASSSGLPSEPPGAIPPNGLGGLSTGAKAGIGVGVAIAILGLGFGAFFLGMSVRKKSQNAPSEEVGYAGDKPELGGKALYTHDVTAELEAGHHTGDAPTVVNGAAKPLSMSASELAQPAQPAQMYIPPSRAELNAQPTPPEIDSRYAAQELGDYRQGSPVSPVSDSGHPDLTRDGTYNDPQILQNPWAQDESTPRKI